MMWKNERITYFDLKKEATCFAPDGLLATYFDPKRLQATCFVPEDRHLKCYEIEKHRDTSSVPVEHHLIFLDPERLQAIYSDPEEHQAICFDPKSQTESKVEVTYSVLEGPQQHTCFDQDVGKATCFDQDVKNRQVIMCFLNISIYYIYSM